MPTRCKNSHFHLASSSQGTNCAKAIFGYPKYILYVLQYSMNIIVSNIIKVPRGLATSIMSICIYAVHPITAPVIAIRDFSALFCLWKLRIAMTGAVAKNVTLVTSVSKSNPKYKRTFDMYCTFTSL